jgi:dipeptidyl aminopeptidase/acylaminoacyl peptidase
MEKANQTERYPISRYLNTRAAYFPSFSSDGKQIAFITDITGVPQVWRVNCFPELEAELWPDQLTYIPERVMGVWYSPAPGDARLIFARDVGGDENQQLFLLSTEGDASTCLTAGFEKAMHSFGEWSKNGMRILFAANRREPGLFDLYLQPLDGKAILVWRNDEPGYLTNLTFSPDEERVLLTRMSSSFRHDLIEVNLASGEARTLSPADEDTRYDAICYAPDGNSIFINTDLGSDFLHIDRLDLESGEIENVVSHQWDAEYMTLSPDGRLLAYDLNVDGASEFKVLDLTTGSTRSAPIESRSPGATAWWDQRLVFSADSQYLAFSFTSATRTSDIFVWDLAGDRVRAVTRSSHGGVPVASFSSPEAVHYPTFDSDRPDGVKRIPAWFFKPHRTDDSPAPVILVVHGGPESQFRPGFNPFIQFVLNHGYAVLAPNVRGSTGYGKAYSHLDDVRKRMDSVADLAHGAAWLKDQPDIDGDRLVVYGGSYGGFMVLSALTTYPDVWAAGVDIVGISNFVTFLENTSAYRRGHREAEYGSLESDREFLESISPSNYLDAIAVPLMVIHGANDPRVPLGEAEQIVDALAGRGIPVQFIKFEDEGHGLSRLRNKLVAYPAIVDFLDKHLES